MEPLIKDLEQKLDKEVRTKQDIDKVKRKIDGELSEAREIIEERGAKIEELTQHINKYETQLSSFNSK